VDGSWEGDVIGPPTDGELLLRPHPESALREAISTRETDEPFCPPLHVFDEIMVEREDTADGCGVPSIAFYTGSSLKGCDNHRSVGSPMVEQPRGEKDQTPRMKLMATTETILERIREVTGTSVEIVEDAEQDHLARMTRARDGADRHLLRTNPTMGDPNYLIVYECGFILRQFEPPPDRRIDFAPTTSGREEMERLVKRAGQTARLPDTVIPMLVDQFFTGLLVQLRSLPIGMRIDIWIEKKFPDLLELQREAVARQQSDNLSVLKPEVKQFAPKAAYDPNATMNAA